MRDFSEILRGEAVFREFRQRADTRVPQNVCFVFLMQFGLRQVAAFRIVSDTLVLMMTYISHHFLVSYLGTEALTNPSLPSPRLLPLPKKKLGDRGLVRFSFEATTCSQVFFLLLRRDRLSN